MKSFDRLAIADSSQLVFGTAPHPVRTRQGLEIGGGSVYPELNFTLPQMTISAETMPDIRQQYAEIISGSMQRAVELDAPGVVIEFETLPPMCENPAWGIELAQILMEGMEKAHATHGLRSVLRMTPNDLREMTRPPLMRSGPLLENTLRTFEGAAAAGAELLSIESVGGKELNDEYLLQCDLGGVLFALTVLGVRDMRFLWTEIVRIAGRFNAIPAGDTACGFANTAMVLARSPPLGDFEPQMIFTDDARLSDNFHIANHEKIGGGLSGPNDACCSEHHVQVSASGRRVELQASVPDLRS